MDSEHLNQFVNALQLCITSKVVRIRDCSPPDNNIILDFRFKDDRNNDIGLKYFEKLVPGNWFPGVSRNEQAYVIRKETSIVDPTITDFLYLTRLKEDNIRTLAELNPKYTLLAKKLGIEPLITNKIHTLKEASAFIFSIVEKKDLTLRQIAEASGLTQVSLSNFKAGKDILLSNFIKIVQAAGIEIKLK